MRRINFNRILYSDTTWAFILLLPNFLGFMIFLMVPMVVSFGMSFVSWDLFGPVRWVGLGNYIELFFEDQVFRRVFWNTLYFTAVTVPISIVLSLLLALAMDQKIIGIRFFRVAYFMPVISSMIAVAIVWQWIYNPEFGLLNYILGLIGIEGQSWLSDVFLAMPAIIVVAIWQGLGFNMLLFLAGLQGISEIYYEAAEVDGAGWFQKFWNITIPLLAPTTFFILVMAVIGALQAFDAVYLMTAGGPARATSVLAHYLFQNAFQYFRMGYASAIAYVLFFLVLSFTLIQLRRQRAWFL